MNDEASEIYQKIRPFVKKEILENQDSGLYTVDSQYHTHNGIDSPLIDILSGGNGTLAAAGANTEIQFNENGVLGARSDFSVSGNILTIPGVIYSLIGIALSGPGINPPLITIGTPGADFDIQLFTHGIGIINLIHESTGGVYINNSTYGSTLKLEVGLFTAPRTATFQDASGTLAYLSDITNTPPGGSNTYVQYNDSSVFGGSANFTFDKSAGGNFFVSGQDGSASGAGGYSSLNGGLGGATTGDGGGVFLNAGNAQNGNSSGGSIEMTTGSGSGTQPGGDIAISANQGGTTGRGGVINFNAGPGGATSGDGGSIGLNGGSATAGDDNGGDVVFTAGAGEGTGLDGSVIIGSSRVPTSAIDTGTAGSIAWDSGFIYICIATDTWKRVAISSW